MPNQGTSGSAQGPGAGKPGGKAPAPRAAHPRRGGLANLDQEQSARLLIFGAVAVVVIIALGFLAFGYWYTVIKPRNRTVLRVDSQTVSYTAMKRRMAYEFLRNTTYQSQNGIQILPAAAATPMRVRNAWSNSASVSVTLNRLSACVTSVSSFSAD